MKPTIYVMAYRHSDMFLIGPFATDAEAADYGATAQAKLWNDDPRWQTMDLIETWGIRIEAPADLGVVPGAYRAACAA